MGRFDVEASGIAVASSRPRGSNVYLSLSEKDNASLLHMIKLPTPGSKSRAEQQLISSDSEVNTCCAASFKPRNASPRKLFPYPAMEIISNYLAINIDCIKRSA